MEIGLFTEFQCPPGMDEARAFDESLAQWMNVGGQIPTGACSARCGCSPSA